MKQTVIEMLNTAVKEFGDQTYVSGKTDEGWQSHSYGEVRETAKALAAGLLTVGAAPKSMMSILAEGSPEWVVSELAILYTGGVSVPLSMRLLASEIPFRINHSESTVLFLSHITAEKVGEALPQFENDTIIFVYLSEKTEVFDRMLASIGRKRGDGAYLYSELLEKGEQAHDALAQVEELALATAEDDTATLCYTSGTTGDPKAIMLTHKNYWANCRDSVEAFKVPYRDYSTLIILPCDHSFAHTVGLYASLMRGITLYFVDARGGSMSILRNIPKNLVEAAPVFLLTVPALSGNFMKKIIRGVEEKGGLINAIFTAGIKAGIAYYGDCYHTPSFWTRAKAYLPYKLADLLIFPKVRSIFGKKIKFCVGGGALLELGQQQFFKALGVPIYQGYGLTEAAPVISSNVPGAHKLGSSGKVMPTIECRICDEEGRDLPQGVKGEIVIRGENVMAGYFKNPEATAKTLKEGWLHTGDLGYIDEDGFLMVVGREKALLISKDGEKYSPEEIEEAIVTADGNLVQQAMLYNDHSPYTVALLVPDPEAVGAYRRRNPDAGADEILELFQELLTRFRSDQALKERFPAQWVPSSFLLIDEPFNLENGFLNSTSKMVRYKIAEAYHEEIDYLYSDEGREFTNPRNRKSVENLTK